MKTTYRSVAKKTACLLFVGVIAALAVMLGGCTSFIFGGSDFGKIEFTRHALTLDVGDTFDLTTIIDGRSTYILSSSDGAVVSIERNVITAKKAGRAVITAETALYEDKLTVTVREPEPDSLSVSYVGDLVQTVGATTDIRFYAETSGNVSDGTLDWYVNDSKAASGALPSESFVYTPSASGEFEVKAVCGRYESNTHTVRVFYPIDATLSVNGALEQNGAPYTPITLAVNAEVNPDNPDNYIEWSVDGEITHVGAEYVYSPVAGRHEIKATVNGKLCDTVSVACAGSVTPAAPTVEFDNLYPHAYVKFDTVGAARVEITSPSGSVATYSSADGKPFDGNGLDIGGLVDLCASGASRRSYRFRVKSLGDGDLIGESEYSPYVTFMQLPSSAKRYLETRYCDRDLYITSDFEYANALEYYVMSRSKTGSGSSVSFNCYIAYDMSGSAEDLWDSAFETVATSGTYSGIDVRMNGNVMHTEFKVNTVNTPTRQTYTGSNSREYARQLHAVLPHINYDADEYRAPDHVFPIDLLENTQSVAYSDELFFAAQNNARPVPVKGSAAESVYELARDVLRKICTNGMSDVQKAHAIYDWIMWQVTYDTPATEIDRGGEAYSAYYLEGVFGNGSAAIGGYVYSPYAVCDGISKAYSLMCNIEGIPCVRVCGDAGSSLSDAGGHAWNKVRINGEWYVVDCTWGDSQGDITLDGSERTYELGLHDWLFLSDRDADSTHFEPFEAGLSEFVYAPETPARGLDVYSEMTYFGVEIDCSIERGENILARVKDIATSFAKAYQNTKTLTVPDGADGGVYPIDYTGLDIIVRGDMTVSDGEISREIKAAVAKVRPRATVNVVIYDNIIILLMKG